MNRGLTQRSEVRCVFGFSRFYLFDDLAAESQGQGECMYDILQSSKSGSSTQHTRGKYRKTGLSSNFFPGPVAFSGRSLGILHTPHHTIVIRMHLSTHDGIWYPTQIPNVTAWLSPWLSQSPWIGGTNKRQSVYANPKKLQCVCNWWWERALMNLLYNRHTV